MKNWSVFQAIPPVQWATVEKKAIILFVKFNFNMVTFSLNLKRFRKKATSISREKGYKILYVIKKKGSQLLEMVLEY